MFVCFCPLIVTKALILELTVLQNNIVFISVLFTLIFLNPLFWKVKIIIIIATVVDKNDHVSFTSLFLFAQHCFHHRRRVRKMLSIASAFNNQIRDEAVDIQSGSAPVTPPASYTATRKKHKINVEEDSLRILEQNVSSKVSDGDF